MREGVFRPNFRGNFHSVSFDLLNLASKGVECKCGVTPAPLSIVASTPTWDAPQNREAPGHCLAGGFLHLTACQCNILSCIPSASPSFSRTVSSVMDKMEDLLSLRDERDFMEGLTEFLELTPGEPRFEAALAVWRSLQTQPSHRRRPRTLRP